MFHERSKTETFDFIWDAGIIEINRLEQGARAPLLAELIIAAWFERKFEGENSSMLQAVAMRA